MAKNFKEHPSIDRFMDLSKRYLLEARVDVSDASGVFLGVCIDLPGVGLISRNRPLAAGRSLHRGDLCLL